MINKSPCRCADRRGVCWSMRKKRVIHSIHGTCPIERFTRARKGLNILRTRRKQTARSSLAWKNACVWLGKRRWRRLADGFSRRVRSVKCCYIPANSSDNPGRSLLPRTFHPPFFPSHPITCDVIRSATVRDDWNAQRSISYTKST